MVEPRYRACILVVRVSVRVAIMYVIISKEILESNMEDLFIQTWETKEVGNLRKSLLATVKLLFAFK